MAASLMICIISLSGCGGPDRSWQNKKDFVDRRTTLYNSYVVNGGFRKRDVDSMTAEEKKVYNRAKHDVLGDSDKS